MEGATRPGITIALAFIAIIIFLGLSLHFPSTSAFFYNDDFGHLERVAYQDTFSGIIKSFNPNGKVLGSRPVGELFFFTCNRLFGFNPKAFHLACLFIHAVNAALVFLIARRISRDDVVALVSGILFASHFAIAWDVMWLGAAYDLSAGLFFFGSFLLYLHCDGRRFYSPFHIFSAISFILAIRAKEMAVTLPAVLSLYEISKSFLAKTDHKKNSWLLLLEIFKKQGVYYVIGLTYVVLTFMGSTGLPAEGPYAFQLDIHTFLDGTRFYLNLLLLKPPFFDNVFYVIILAALIVPFILKDRQLIFGFFYLWISLLPVIFLANHQYDLYLYIPIFGFSFYVANVIIHISTLFEKFSVNYGKIIRITIAIGFLIAYGLINQPKLNFVQDWFRTAARSYERCVSQLKNLYPTLPHGAHLYFIDLPPSFIEFPHWEKVAYQDPSLRTIYDGDMDLIQLSNKNRADTTYVFKYTTSKLRDVTNFCKKGITENNLSHPYIELTREFDKARKKSPYPNQIYIKPYCTINFDQYRAIYLGPRAGITFYVELPENPIFESAIAVPPNLWNTPGDGVNFTVAVKHSCDCGEEVVFSKFIDPVNNESDRRWHDVKVDLSSLSNQRTHLVLQSDSVGDVTSEWADWTAWADPMIITNPAESINKIVKN